MSTLTRHDIIMELRRVMGLSPRNAAKALHLVVKTIRAALESGDAVQIHGFGWWHPVYVRPRTYRSRKTGLKIRKNAQREIKFQPCASFMPGHPKIDDGMVNPSLNPPPVGALNKNGHPRKRRLGIEKARTHKRPF